VANAVGINDRRALIAKDFGDDGLAGADAAGEADYVGQARILRCIL
jgi:hypothetical protein